MQGWEGDAMARDDMPNCTLGAMHQAIEGTALPLTPAGRQLAAFLRAFNSGPANANRDFIAEHCAAAALKQQSVMERASWDALAYARTRGLIPAAIEQSSDHEIIVLAHTQLTGEDARVTLQVAPEAPHPIIAYDLQHPIRPPASRACGDRAGTMSDAAMIQELERFLGKLVDADVFSGAVLVARDGEPLFAKAYGLASKSFAIPNDVDTKFNVGSMNKMFTAVAIAQLAQRDAFSFDDPIKAYLPDYPSEAADKVTIHHLLTHTSGIADYFNAAYDRVRFTLRNVDSYLPLFANKPLAFEPGTRWEYSNGGFVVLGSIIERVSGQDYFDYIHEHITDPAGMVDTAFYDLDRDVPNLAVGYTNLDTRYAPEPMMRPMPGPRLNNLFMLGVKGSPAGGGYSTVGDLLKFDIALRRHALLAPDYTATVLTGKVAREPQPGAEYAYGFFVDRVNGTLVVGHGGALPGGNAEFDMYLDLGYTVVVLSNYDPPAAVQVRFKLFELLTQA